MSYTAESIAVLKGLEPVRHRPGMYTRIDCPLHIIQEAIDNAADEALGGFCKRITVTLHADQSVSVEDDGRGIPVEIHPLEQVPTVEVVFTRLHAGGKFNKDERESAYRFSGGLHGVGVSVTNALSTRLEVEVVRDGGRHRMAFAGGSVLEPLQRIGDAPKKASGTRLRAWPDASFFDSPLIPLPQLERLLRSKALLLPGLQVSLQVEGGATREWCFADGMLQYLSEQIEGEAVAPVFSGEKYAPKGDENFPVGSGAAWAICWSSRRQPGARILRQPDSHAVRRDARNRSAPGRFDAVKKFCRSSRAAAQGHQAGRRRRLFLAPASFSRRACSIPRSRARPRNA
jgi:topoisomerase-4 subunit B